MNLDFSTFTWVHVIISLVGIVTGFVVMKGMLASQRLDDWTDPIQRVTDNLSRLVAGEMKP